MQALAICLNSFALLGKQAHKLEAVEEAHAMANHRAQHHHFFNPGDGEFQRNHFSGSKFTGNHGPETVLRNLETAPVDANVSVLCKHADNKRHFGAIAGIAAGGRFMRMKRQRSLA